MTNANSPGLVSPDATAFVVGGLVLTMPFLLLLVYTCGHCNSSDYLGLSQTFFVGGIAGLCRFCWKRRRFAFSLQSLLLTVASISFCSSWIGVQHRLRSDEHEAISVMSDSLGGSVVATQYTGWVLFGRVGELRIRLPALDGKGVDIILRETKKMSHLSSVEISMKKFNAVTFEQLRAGLRSRSPHISVH